jgi:ParB-like nuclease domain/DNA methylase
VAASPMRTVTQTYAIRPIASVTRHPRNYREHDLEALAESVDENGFYGAVYVQKSTQLVIAGNGRHFTAERAGATEIPVIELDVDDATALKILIADNATSDRAKNNAERLAALLAEAMTSATKLRGTGHSEESLSALLAGIEESRKDRDNDGEASKPKGPNLHERFGIPPFSVLDARQGYWQERKREWLALGIRSELGRGENVTYQSRQVAQIDFYKKKREREAGRALTFGQESLGRIKAQIPGHENDANIQGTSIFDPVLCELAYRWFVRRGGVVLDPFAGGSVRGVVAAKLSRKYVGIELRAEQVAANREQWEEIAGEDDPDPEWIEGDSRERLVTAPDADFVFSCPPYADLEVYSDNPRDLSTFAFPAFVEGYRDIVAKAVLRLREDRFALFVVGEVRAPDGFYRDFVGETIRAFRDAGARLYNDAILITRLGSLPIRAGRAFDAGRKLGKTHQNVLVFVKGDARRATEWCGAVEGGVTLGDELVPAERGTVSASDFGEVIEGVGE